MPSGKQRKLDDTWKESELAKSVKEARDGKKSRDRDRDKDKKKERHRDEDDRKKERKHRSEDDREHRKDRERRHRDKENGDVERRDKSRSKRTEDDDRERRHRKDKERRHDEDRKHRSSKDKDGERSHKSSRHKDEDDDRERRHRKHKDRDENEDREKRHRKRDGDENDDRERRRKHRDEDDDRERKHRKDKDEEDDEERQRRREERRKRHEEKKRKEEEEKRQRELEEQKHEGPDDKYDSSTSLSSDTSIVHDVPHHKTKRNKHNKIKKHKTKIAKHKDMELKLTHAFSETDYRPTKQKFKNKVSTGRSVIGPKLSACYSSEGLQLRQNEAQLGYKQSPTEVARKDSFFDQTVTGSNQYMGALTGFAFPPDSPDSMPSFHTGIPFHNDITGIPFHNDFTGTSFLDDVICTNDVTDCQSNGHFYGNDSVKSVGSLDKQKLMDLDKNGDLNSQRIKNYISENTALKQTNSFDRKEMVATKKVNEMDGVESKVFDIQNQEDDIGNSAEILSYQTTLAKDFEHNAKQDFEDEEIENLKVKEIYNDLQNQKLAQDKQALLDNDNLDSKQASTDLLLTNETEPYKVESQSSLKSDDLNLQIQYSDESILSQGSMTANSKMERFFDKMRPHSMSNPEYVIADDSMRDHTAEAGMRDYTADAAFREQYMRSRETQAADYFFFNDPMLPQTKRSRVNPAYDTVHREEFGERFVNQSFRQSNTTFETHNHDKQNSYLRGNSHDSGAGKVDVNARDLHYYTTGMDSEASTGGGESIDTVFPRSIYTRCHSPSSIHSDNRCHTQSSIHTDISQTSLPEDIEPTTMVATLAKSPVTTVAMDTICKSDEGMTDNLKNTLKEPHLIVPRNTTVASLVNVSNSNAVNDTGSSQSSGFRFSSEDGSNSKVNTSNSNKAGGKKHGGHKKGKSKQSPVRYMLSTPPTTNTENLPQVETADVKNLNGTSKRMEGTSTSGKNVTEALKSSPIKTLETSLSLASRKTESTPPLGNKKTGATNSASKTTKILATDQTKHGASVSQATPSTSLPRPDASQKQTSYGKKIDANLKAGTSSQSRDRSVSVERNPIDSSKRPSVSIPGVKHGKSPKVSSGIQENSSKLKSEENNTEMSTQRSPSPGGSSSRRHNPGQTSVTAGKTVGKHQSGTSRKQSVTPNTQGVAHGKSVHGKTQRQRNSNSQQSGASQRKHSVSYGQSWQRKHESSPRKPESSPRISESSPRKPDQNVSGKPPSLPLGNQRNLKTSKTRPDPSSKSNTKFDPKSPKGAIHAKLAGGNVAISPRNSIYENPYQSPKSSPRGSPRKPLSAQNSTTDTKEDAPQLKSTHSDETSQQTKENIYTLDTSRSVETDTGKENKISKESIYSEKRTKEQSQDSVYAGTSHVQSDTGISDYADDFASYHSDVSAVPTSSGMSLWSHETYSISSVKKQEEDEYDYDDDFEDYEDDFEDDDGDDDKKRYDDSDDGDRRKYSSDDDSDYDRKKKEKPKKSANEMDEIMQAMNEENERLISESRRKDWPQEESDDDRYNSRSSRDKAPPGGRTFINFVSAKQRVITDQASNKTRRRGRELLNIIELDVAKFDIFDLPPVHEYNLYMRAFGSSNTKQAYIQTNDDNIERDIQTEPIEYTEKWSQHPPEDFNCCGGTDDNNKDELDSKPVDTAGLYKFIKRAGQTVLTLLEEDLAERMQADQSRKQSNIIVSEAYVELGQVNMLKGRHVLYSYFSPTQTHLLLTVYSQSTEPGEHAKKGLICVWNVNEPSQPQKYLLCESQPHCCCFSPSKATIAFAGTSDGSVLAWDLREPSSIHRQHRDTGEVLRFPTYNTAGVLQYENHISPVISMHPVVAPDSGGDSALEGGDAGDSQSFQLATLEENSVINLWVVAEITNPDRAGSASDLGLAPGGRVKLIKSSSVILESPLRNKRLKTTVQSFDMQLLPSNNSHFYVTTNTGCVIHGVRYGGKSHPKAYYPTDNAMVTVTSLDFSPFSEPVFLIGCDDGTIRLHHTNSEHPLITWSDTTEGRCIQCIRWCRSRPSVFFVLDDSSQLYIWDLQMSDAVPMKVERIAKDRVTNFNLSNDHSATGSGLPGRKPQMLVGLENGASEVHTVSREFSALMGEEVDTFAAFIKSNA